MVKYGTMKLIFGPSFHWGDRHTGGIHIGCRPVSVRVALLGAVIALALAVAPQPVSAKKDDDPGDDDERLEVSEKRSMAFGTVTSSADGSGTVVLSPNGGLSTTGYATILKDRSRVGEFKIEGPDRATVIITLPSSVTFSNGTSTTTLTNFTSSPPAGVATLDRRGKLTLMVGATMNIPANQNAGDYTGTFTIYVDQQ